MPARCLWLNYLPQARGIGLETQLETSVTERDMTHLSDIAARGDEVKGKM